MKLKSITVRTLWSTFFFVLLAGLAQGLQAAEKKKVTWTSKYGPVQQRIAAPVGGQAGHDLVQQVRQDMTASSDADFDGTTVVVTGQSDLVKGSGPIRGYATRTHKNGDQSFMKYEGTVKRSGDAINWQTLADGTVEFIGGTGKFANIKGSGTFTSKAGPDGGGATVTVDVEY